MNEKTKQSKKIASRKDLISFFKKGNLPREEHFEKLIHSNFNKADDRLDIDEEHGMMIYPASEGKLINFYQKSEDESPKYVLSISEKGMFFREQKEVDEKVQEQPDFFIRQTSGNVGIGTEDPRSKLEVLGKLTATGRVGSFKEGRLPADGKWYNVFDTALTDVHAFEIMAYARGTEKKGRYSIMHAISTCAFGKFKTSKTCAYYNSRYDRIQLRWVNKKSRMNYGIMPEKGKKRPTLSWWKRLMIYFFEQPTMDYNLQLRTGSNYETSDKEESDDISLFYKLSVLWDPQFEPRNKSAMGSNETS